MAASTSASEEVPEKTTSRPWERGVRDPIGAHIHLPKFFSTAQDGYDNTSPSIRRIGTFHNFHNWRHTTTDRSPTRKHQHSGLRRENTSKSLRLSDSSCPWISATLILLPGHVSASSPRAYIDTPPRTRIGTSRGSTTGATRCRCSTMRVCSTRRAPGSARRYRSSICSASSGPAWRTMWGIEAKTTHSRWR